MTMLKIDNRQLKMSSAGMPPVYIYRRETDSVEEHQFEGMPLGTMNKFPYKVKETKLKTGDVILLLTDGFPELKNEKKEMYGYQKTRDSIMKVSRMDPEEIINHLKNEGSNWVNDKDPDDDVTFVVIKIK